MDCCLVSWQAVVWAPLVGTLVSPLIAPLIAAGVKSNTVIAEEAEDWSELAPACCYACLLIPALVVLLQSFSSSIDLFAIAVAAIVATRNDDMLRDLFKHMSEFDLSFFSNSTASQFVRHFLLKGTLQDIEVLQKRLRRLLGDLTFLEAFILSGAKHDT